MVEMFRVEWSEDSSPKGGPNAVEARTKNKSHVYKSHTLP